MKKKIFAFIVAFAFSLNVVGAAFADVKTKSAPRQTQPLAASLPISDLVVAANSDRLLNQALPQVLAANQTMLKSILDKIDEIKNNTGVDLRQFEQFALGVASKKSANGDFDFEPVILAQGKIDAAAFVSLAKIAIGGKYREEKIAGKTIYIFTPAQVVKKTAPQNNKGAGNKTANNQSVFDKAMDKMFDKLSREFAVTAFDANTLTIGTTARVRETLQAKTRLGADVLSLINRKPNAIVNLALKVPNGMSSFIDLDNDELGKNIDSIRQISGAMDFSEGNAIVTLAAKTLKPEQAQSLKETLNGLQMVGAAMIGSSKGADKKVLSRLIETAQVSNAAGEVTLELKMPQSDIDILVGVK